MHEREPVRLHYPDRLTFLDMANITASTDYIYNHSSESTTVQESQLRYVTGPYITRLTESTETERATGKVIRPASITMTYTDEVFALHGYNINFYIDEAADESTAAYISPYPPTITALNLTTNIGYTAESLLLSLANGSDDAPAACKALTASITDARIVRRETTTEQMLELSPISEVTELQRAFRLAQVNGSSPFVTTIRHTLCAPTADDRLYITYFDEASKLDRLVTHSVATETQPIDTTLLLYKDATVREVLQRPNPDDRSDDRPYYARVADETTMVTRKAAYHDIRAVQDICNTACLFLQGKS